MGWAVGGGDELHYSDIMDWGGGGGGVLVRLGTGRPISPILNAQRSTPHWLIRLDTTNNFKQKVTPRKKII